MSCEEKIEFIKNEIALEFDHYDCAVESHDEHKANYHKGVIDGMARVMKFFDKGIYDTRNNL